MKRIYFLFLASLILASCKKTDNTALVPPAEVITSLSVTIDGQKTTVAESAMDAIYYSDDTNPIKSLEVSAALDANGAKKLIVLLQDLKEGKITLAPKTSTSADNQTFISYKNGDKTYFATTGTVTVTVDAATKTAKVNWEATFSDGVKDYNINGNYTVVNYDAIKKPVAQLKKGYPIVADDTYNTEFDTKLSGTVAANDTDPNGGTLTFKTYTNPNNGTLVFNTNGTFEYTPKAGYSGQDAFQYEAINQVGLASKANVVITVKSKTAPGTPAVMKLKRNGVEVSPLHSGKITYQSTTLSNGTLWTLGYDISWSGGAEFLSGGFGNALLAGPHVQLADGKVFDFNDPDLSLNPFPWRANNQVFSGLKYQTADSPNTNRVTIVKFDKTTKFISLTGKLQFGGVTYEFEMEGTYAE